MGKSVSARPATNSDDAMTVSPSATAVSKLERGRVRTPSTGSEVTSGRFALRQTLTAVQAAQRERTWTRSTRSEAMMCCRRRMLSAIVNGFLVAAGKRTKSPPIACSSPASPPESVATSARAPVSASAAVTASVARSSPPAASGGTIWRIVRPASGALAPRRKGERASRLTAGAASNTRA